MTSFICNDCRGSSHETCPGKSWCDCQHRSKAQVLADIEKQLDGGVWVTRDRPVRK